MSIVSKFLKDPGSVVSDWPHVALQGCYQCGQPIDPAMEPEIRYPRDHSTRYHVRCRKTARSYLDQHRNHEVDYSSILYMQSMLADSRREIAGTVADLELYRFRDHDPTLDSFLADLDEIDRALIEFARRVILKGLPE